MPPLRPRAELSTHEVINQPPGRGDSDLWAGDGVLRHYATLFGARPDEAAAHGLLMGGEEMREAGREANRNPPELRAFDPMGRRIDEVVFHPAYHRLLGAGLEAGYAARPWEDAPGGHATHAVMVYMQNQVEPGVACPMTMTYAAVPALRHAPALADEWLPRLLSRRYDAASRPAPEKTGATIGMAMTEKQGGSDVRSNTTRATPDGDGYRLRGHKWFCSAPMCDAFLTLAQAPGGLTCFLVPRWTPEGARNGFHIMRLKDKLGNRANASSEIEYHDAWAERIGDEGAGVKTIVEMVHHTRLDTAVAPAGLMRAALAEALWWVNSRTAFQRRLIDQPLMRSVLADMALEQEAATALGMRVAQSFDGDGGEDRAFARIGVALAKFLTNKLAPGFVYEAMECLGGVGYVEENPLPMLYREAPLNSIWEGSGNVICLDILRTLDRVPEAGAALFALLDGARGADRRYDAALKDFRARWPKGAPEPEARLFAERLARLMQAAILLAHAPAAVADAFTATRLAGPRADTYGALALADTGALIERVMARA